MHACPVDAIKLDAGTGAKMVLEATCVGWKVCTIACPLSLVTKLQLRDGNAAKLRFARPATGCAAVEGWTGPRVFPGRRVACPSRSQSRRASREAELPRLG
jgi:Fe-S-cluster-containing hydrogenase component 2